MRARHQTVARRPGPPRRAAGLWQTALVLLGLLAGGAGLAGAGCRPLIRINPDTGRTEGDAARPLCDRVVDRMIRCSTDAAFRDRLRANRARAVAACRREGRADAARCDPESTCEGFVRCLAQ